MLALHFKTKLTPEQDMRLFDILEKYPPLHFEFDGDSYDQKVSFFAQNQVSAKKIYTNLLSLGFRCSANYYNLQIFHPDFIDEALKERPLEYAHLLEQQDLQELDQKPIEEVLPAPEAVVPNQETPRPPSTDVKPIVAHLPQVSPIPTNFATSEQIELLSKRIEELAAQNRRIIAKPPMTPTTSAPPPPRAIQSADFTAKNELIANGIRCERCKISIKGIEPIGALMMAVREHVMTHFDSDNPMLKRYECRKCDPKFRTNFVDDMERHLKKHDSFMSVTQKRQQLVQNLVTETHLKLICQLCKVCFPEVFEKTPPAIGSILAVDTPAKAKASVFPRFDRLFCTKYKIPNHCNARSSLPIPLIQI